MLSTSDKAKEFKSWIRKHFKPLNGNKPQLSADELKSINDMLTAQQQQLAEMDTRIKQLENQRQAAYKPSPVMFDLSTLDESKPF